MSKVVIFFIISEAREVIFFIFSRPEQSFWSPVAYLDDFWSHCQISLKKVSSPTPPPKASILRLFAIFFLIVFFECSRFGIFELLDARRLHFNSHFDSFLRALGVLKNRQKCVRVVNFRGLASSECDFFEDFDHECVLTLIFFQIL